MSTEQKIAEEINRTRKDGQKYAAQALDAPKQVAEDVAKAKDLADEYGLNPLTGEYKLKKFGAWNVLKNKGKPKA